MLITVAVTNRSEKNLLSEFKDLKLDHKICS